MQILISLLHLVAEVTGRCFEIDFISGRKLLNERHQPAFRFLVVKVEWAFPADDVGRVDPADGLAELGGDGGGVASEERGIVLLCSEDLDVGVLVVASQSPLVGALVEIHVQGVLHSTGIDICSIANPLLLLTSHILIQ